MLKARAVFESMHTSREGRTEHCGLLQTGALKLRPTNTESTVGIQPRQYSRQQQNKALGGVAAKVF